MLSRFVLLFSVCSFLLLCSATCRGEPLFSDDFEARKAGQPPDPEKWQIVWQGEPGKSVLIESIGSDATRSWCTFRGQDHVGIRSKGFGARTEAWVEFSLRMGQAWPSPQGAVVALVNDVGGFPCDLRMVGRPDGTFTERVAFAITELIRREKVDLAIDLHEAAPEYPVVNTIVAHERASDLAALVNMNLQAMGIAIGMEASPKNLHGLSHREWGDNTPALAVLMETTQPAMGRLRGRTSAELAVEGKDKFYVLAAERHRLSVPFPEGGWPIEIRVGRHLAGVTEFARNLGDLWPEKKITLSGVPDYPTIVQKHVGAFLN